MNIDNVSCKVYNLLDVKILPYGDPDQGPGRPRLQHRGRRGRRRHLHLIHPLRGPGRCLGTGIRAYRTGTLINRLMSLFFAFYKRMNALYNKRLNWQAKKFKSWKISGKFGGYFKDSTFLFSLSTLWREFLSKDSFFSLNHSSCLVRSYWLNSIP